MRTVINPPSAPQAASKSASISCSAFARQRPQAVLQPTVSIKHLLTSRVILCRAPRSSATDVCAHVIQVLGAPVIPYLDNGRYNAVEIAEERVVKALVAHPLFCQFDCLRNAG
jgi:hypothetical protein